MATPMVTILMNRDQKSFLIVFLYWLCVVGLTFSLPENVLERFPILQGFVGVMKGIFPPVANFGKYSEFPQVSQLVYSIEIILMSFISIPLYKALELKWDIRNELEKPILFIIRPILFFCGSIIMLLLLPPEPDFSTRRLRAVSAVYYGKLSFTFITTLLLVGSVGCMLLLIALVRDFLRYFQNRNNNYMI